jgi:hypothetical protein
MSARSDPSGDFLAVTPHDTNPIVSPGLPTRGLYIGGAGAVVATGSRGNVTFAAVPVGTILPIQCTHVLSTGTTATNIVALY